MLVGCLSEAPHQPFINLSINELSATAQLMDGDFLVRTKWFKGRESHESMMALYSKKNSATPMMLTARPMSSLGRMRFRPRSTSGTKMSTGVSAISVDAMPAGA